MEKGKNLKQENDQLEEINYRALVEGINDVIFFINLDGNFSYISPVIENIYGYNSDELKGESFNKFIYSEDLPVFIKKFNSLLSGNNFDDKSEFRIVNKDESIYWVRVSLNVTKNKKGDTRGFIGSIVDISEQKRDQESIQNYMHILNHDLKSPLNIILGFSDLLVGEENYSTEESAKFLGYINEASKRMLAMMESYLTLEKIERGQAKLNKIPKTILEVISDLKKSFSNLRTYKCGLKVFLKNPKDNSLNFEITEKTVLVDEILLSSLITNLFKNAVEAMSSQNEKNMMIVNIFEEGKYFCLSVSNQGEIPEEFRENLFKKFSTSKKSGTGLGLYSAKLIAKAHGGDVIYSPLSGETRFIVKIPF